MESFYTTEDIQEFLAFNGIEWDGENKNKSKNDVVIAELQFSGDEYAAPSEFQLSVSPIQFYIYGLGGHVEVANFSQDWRINLIAKYPDKASIIIKMIDDRMKEIYDFYEDSIKTHEEEIKQIKHEQREALKDLKETKKAIVDPEKEKGLI